LDKYDLMSRSKEELITLVGRLMDKLTEKERLEFVSKWLSPQAALAVTKGISIYMNQLDAFNQYYAKFS